MEAQNGERFHCCTPAGAIFQKGRLVYRSPDIADIRAYCARQVDNLWDEVKRFENPHNYYVDLSQKLWDVREELLNEH